MITKKEILKKVLDIRGIIDNDDINDKSKIGRIEIEINYILLGSIKDPYNKRR